MRGEAVLKNKFFKEQLGRIIVSFFGIFIIVITLAITFFLFYQGSATFTVHKNNLVTFLFGSYWDPSILANQNNHQIGSAIFIIGSLSVSLLALLFATPLALAVALFTTEISPKLGKRFIQPAVEIFVGIPSVVYGWVGIMVLCPFIANVFGLVFGGQSILAAAIVLTLMIFPTIASVSTDALRNVPRKYKEASYALGATRAQMMWKVNIPAAFPGILTGIILGLARAFGEALAVSMVLGSRLSFPNGLLSQTATLTTQIAMAMGIAVNGTELTDSVWSMALLLFVISFLLILAIRVVTKKKKEDK
jgi:phosphate ABC transporter, permease protein PstC